jgi:hypothetical protein
MGNIGSHVNITSGWRGHQAKNEAPATCILFSGSPSGADHARLTAWGQTAKSSSMSCFDLTLYFTGMIRSANTTGTHAESYN